MNIYLMDLFPFTLLFLSLYNTKPINNYNSINNDYLSKSTCNSLRGIFSLIVIFHHLSQATSTGIIFPIFKQAGYLAVSVFFFLSGYGLQKSHMASPDYKKHFLQKRLSKLIMPYIFFTLLYWIVYALLGNIYPSQHVIVSLLNGSPIVSHSWYIVCILYFYIFYWMLMHAFKNNYHLIIFFSCLWFVFYFIICKLLSYGIWWYNTPHLLIMGIIFAIYEPKIICIISKCYHIILPVIICLFHFTTIVQKSINNGNIFLLFQMISAILFVFIILLLALKIQFGNHILSFLGKISLEIYLIHGLFMKLLHSNCLYIDNDFLWSLAVIVCSILSGWFLHNIFSSCRNFSNTSTH